MIEYLQCPHCRQIAPKVDWGNKSETPICPFCNSSKPGETWPGTEIRELFNFVLNYDYGAPRYPEIICIYLSRALETLLEQLLFSMMWGEGQEDEVVILIDGLLEKYRGRKNMIDLYKLLNNNSFAADSEFLGHGRFYNEWGEIVKQRNKIVHGEPIIKISMSPDYAGWFVGETLQVFSKLHNKNSRFEPKEEFTEEEAEKSKEEIRKLGERVARMLSDDTLLGN
jgi:hypothetical protein